MLLRKTLAPIALAAVLVAAFGCGRSHEVGTSADPGTPPGPTDVSRLLGPAGGTLHVGTATLVVPPGALPTPTTISVHVSAEPVPGGFTAYSPVYRFGPEGTTFAVPLTLRIPFDGDASLASVFWTRATGAGFVPLSTTVEGGVATAKVTHFSRGFVGTACTGADCCSRANGELDVLFLVDDSSSMGEEQASLTDEIPRMTRALATGDLDGDGVQDFPAVADLHVGVVSSDMGSGGFMVPTCGNGGGSYTFGDDGLLRTAADPSTGCAPSYPPFQTYDASDPTADPDALAHDVACVASLGTSGCGFEQQLESPLKALTPSTSAVTFGMGTHGHGDTDNAGFLRDDSMLAVILLTDEDACTPSDPEIFDPNVSNPTYPGDLNLRCFMYPDAIQPVSRYVDGLLALRGSPNDVIFAAITGVPADLVADPTSIDYDAVLADPRMQDRLDPATPTQLIPSCNVAGRGTAYPPRRIVGVAKGIEDAGGTGIVQSIRQSDFTPAIDAILRRVADRVSGICSSASPG